jgi:hypothetical protein
MLWIRIRSKLKGRNRIRIRNKVMRDQDPHKSDNLDPHQFAEKCTGMLYEPI